MNQVYVDPDKLREFAMVLKEFSRYTADSLIALNTQMARLQNSWQDQEFEKFALHVRKTQVRLKLFATETAKTVPALEQDAETVAEYQKVQLS